MPRARSFDESELLDRVLLAFWRKGFEPCSLNELLEVTGLNRQSLYNAFGNKRALFLRALERYGERVDEALAPLRAEDADVGTLRDYMLGSLSTQEKLGSGACLLVTTAYTPVIDDAEIRGAVRRGARSVRKAMRDFLAGQVARGELPASLDPELGASTLYATLNGLSALSRTGGTRAERERVLDLALANLARNEA